MIYTFIPPRDETVNCINQSSPTTLYTHSFTASCTSSSEWNVQPWSMTPNWLASRNKRTQQFTYIVVSIFLQSSSVNTLTDHPAFSSSHPPVCLFLSWWHNFLTAWRDITSEPCMAVIRLWISLCATFSRTKKRIRLR